MNEGSGDGEALQHAAGEDAGGIVAIGSDFELVDEFFDASVGVFDGVESGVK